MERGAAKPNQVICWTSEVARLNGLFLWRTSWLLFADIRVLTAVAKLLLSTSCGAVVDPLPLLPLLDPVGRRPPF